MEIMTSTFFLKGGTIQSTTVLITLGSTKLKLQEFAVSEVRSCIVSGYRRKFIEEPIERENSQIGVNSCLNSQLPNYMGVGETSRRPD